MYGITCPGAKMRSLPSWLYSIIVLVTVTIAPLMAAESLPVGRPEIVAHRGASFDAPENTMAAVRLAWDQNADAVEVDVFITADQHVVCFHDKELSRTTAATGYIHEKTLGELRALEAGRWKGERWAGEPIPLLGDVLATIPPGKRMFVEIKCGPEITDALASLTAESGKEPAQIAFISFNADACTAIKKALPRHQVYLLSGFDKLADGSYSPALPDLIPKARTLGLDGLDLSHKGPHTAETCRAIRDAGLFLAAWTVNEPKRASELFGMGFQSITTDKPALLVESFRR